MAIVAFAAMDAQDFVGIAVYESITVRKDIDVNVSGKLDPATEAMLKERLKKPFEDTYVLTFDKASSLYEQEQKLQAPHNGRVMPKSFAIGKKYKNVKEKIWLEEREIFGKEFLVSDSLIKMEWKLESESKKIGEYTCYKATYTVKSRAPETLSGQEKAVSLTSMAGKDIVITAWYAPEIPVNHGPSHYWGLPGLILSVSNNHTTILCSKLIINPKEKVEIKAPNKGEKITQKKFAETMTRKAEEMKQMRAEPGHGRKRN